MKKPILTLTARAVADISHGPTACDCGELVDAALGYLQSCGCGLADMRAFLRMLARELRQRGAGLSAQLTTPNGQSGTRREDIAQTLERTLKARILLEEKADPLLLGGAVLAYGDERYDYSLNGALKRLQTQLTAA